MCGEGGSGGHKRISCGRDDGEMGSTECLGVSVWTSLLCAGIRREFHHRASQWECWEQLFHFHMQLLIFDHNHTAFSNPVPGAVAVPNVWDWCLKDRLWSHVSSACFFSKPQRLCWLHILHPGYGVHHFFNWANGCKTISVLKRSLHGGLPESSNKGLCKSEDCFKAMVSSSSAVCWSLVVSLGGALPFHSDPLRQS